MGASTVSRADVALADEEGKAWKSLSPCLLWVFPAGVAMLQLAAGASECEVILRGRSWDGTRGLAMLPCGRMGVAIIH